MTAKDEMMFKTPDALLNGQATVDVIQSCIPAINGMPGKYLNELSRVAIRMTT